MQLASIASPRSAALADRLHDARRAFAEFEDRSLQETHKSDNSNRELIFYYAEHANQPTKALEVERRESVRRHDVYTLDAYAWALQVNGRDAEARDEINTALAIGTRDPGLLRHPGGIGLEP